MTEKIKETVLKFYTSIKDIPGHRYKSWEHCHKYFLTIRNKKVGDKELDLAQLHLAFYLASWGMYRGSSFILQKDYMIFRDIVNIVLNKSYCMLWEIENNIGKREDLSRLFFTIYNEIENKLRKLKGDIKNHPDLFDKEKKYIKSEHISYTLITKILLGTVGCIPAYDRLFKKGLYNQPFIKKGFNPKRSFAQLLDFYIDDKNKREIDDLRINLNNYTIMKIIDMYFWQIGWESEKSEYHKR